MAGLTAAIHTTFTEHTMPEPKTKLNDASVSGFLSKIADPRLREDCFMVVDIMQSAAKAEPRMWGSSIIGFGEHTIQYAGGREAKWMLTGFAPRKRTSHFIPAANFPNTMSFWPNWGPTPVAKAVCTSSDYQTSTCLRSRNWSTHR
jgi:hypothetical protein